MYTADVSMLRREKEQLPSVFKGFSTYSVTAHRKAVVFVVLCSFHTPPRATTVRSQKTERRWKHGPEDNFFLT